MYQSTQLYKNIKASLTKWALDKPKPFSLDDFKSHVYGVAYHMLDVDSGIGADPENQQNGVFSFGILQDESSNDELIPKEYTRLGMDEHFLSDLASNIALNIRPIDIRDELEAGNILSGLTMVAKVLKAKGDAKRQCRPNTSSVEKVRNTLQIFKVTYMSFMDIITTIDDNDLYGYVYKLLGLLTKYENRSDLMDIQQFAHQLAVHVGKCKSLISLDDMKVIRHIRAIGFLAKEILSKNPNLGGLTHKIRKILYPERYGYSSENPNFIYEVISIGNHQYSDWLLNLLYDSNIPPQVYQAIDIYNKGDHKAANRFLKKWIWHSGK